MAMKVCKECGTEVSSRAKSCPKCGKDQRNFFLKHKVLSFILIVIALGVLGSALGGSENNKTESVNSNEVIEYMAINVDTLEKALESNPANAKDTYNGKHLEITGRLGTIDSDSKYISLLSTTDKWDLTGIHCTVKNDEQKEKIKTLNKDDTIVVKGKITDVGEVLGYYLDISEISK